jgi:small subunit ribosomal protein S4
MHGARRGKPSEYGLRLREKQKLKRFYGLLERQFRRYFALASRSVENTGEVLMTLMERRLDNIVCRLGFASSRAAARQLVLHGHITLNGKLCNIPSILCNANDVITIKVRERARRKGTSGESSSKRKRNMPGTVRQLLQETNTQVPDWLERQNSDPPEGKVLRLPTRSDVDPRIKDEVKEQLIIEFCSR